MEASDQADKVKYQLFYEIKLKQLQQLAYPACVEECVASNRSHPGKVFSHDQLQCTQNCLSKYKASLNLAMGLLTLGD